MRRLLTAWRLASRRRSVIPAIHAGRARLAELDAEALRKESRSVGYRLKCGEPIQKLVPDALLLRTIATRSVPSGPTTPPGPRSAGSMSWRTSATAGGAVIVALVVTR